MIPRLITVTGEDDHFDIMLELEPVKVKWRQIGLGLRIRSSKLAEIGVTHKDDIPACLEEMINCWLRMEYKTGKYGPPTWSQLVFAVGSPMAGSSPSCALSIATNHSKTFELDTFRRHAISSCL